MPSYAGSLPSSMNRGTTLLQLKPQRIRAYVDGVLGSKPDFAGGLEAFIRFDEMRRVEMLTDRLRGAWYTVLE
jgi:hypothetical protein